MPHHFVEITLDPLKNKENRIGLILSPWRKPIACSKKLEKSFKDLNRRLNIFIHIFNNSKNFSSYTTKHFKPQRIFIYTFNCLL